MPERRAKRASVIAGLFCLVGLNRVRQKRYGGRMCRFDPAKSAASRQIMPGSHGHKLPRQAGTLCRDAASLAAPGTVCVDVIRAISSA
jgi:hypothetical protein